IYQAGSPAHCGCVAPPAGVVSWWRGDDNFTDARGANNGMDMGAVAFTTGAVASAFSLSGAANSFVSVKDAPTLAFTTAVTIEAWLNPTAPVPPAVAVRMVVASKATIATPTDGYLLDITAAGQLRLYVGNDNLASGAAAVVPTGKLTHVAGVYDGTNI